MLGLFVVNGGCVQLLAVVMPASTQKGEAPIINTASVTSLTTYFTTSHRGNASVWRSSNTGWLGAGSRTTSARGDSAGLALLSQLRNETARLRQGYRNAIHATSMAQAADAGLSRIASFLAESLTLARQAVSGGVAAIEQAPMQAEFEDLLDKLNAVPASMAFNGSNLLTAGNPVVISLAERTGDPSPEISFQAQDMSTEALGLVGGVSNPTYATLTGNSDYGNAAPSNPYLKGPIAAPLAELTFTFHGSQGDKVATIYIESNNTVGDIVALMNSETNALVPGWSAAEAVQVAGNWVLKVTSYEAGEANAPDVAVTGDLVWKNNDPVLPSHFTGQGGTAGSVQEFLLTASDTVEKIEDAIETVAGFQSNLADSIFRLGVASSALQSATGYSLAAESRINDADTATAAAVSTMRQILGRVGMSQVFRMDALSQTALDLLGVPAATPRSETVLPWHVSSLV